MLAKYPNYFISLSFSVYWFYAAVKKTVNELIVKPGRFTDIKHSLNRDKKGGIYDG